jgi:hypothetical protein
MRPGAKLTRVGSDRVGGDRLAGHLQQRQRGGDVALDEELLVAS